MQESSDNSFFPYCNALPPVRNSACYADRQERLPFSEEPYESQSHQHQVGNSCLILLILVYMSPSNPCRTAQWAQRIGYGLQDQQEIYLFSNISTQATSPTHSPTQLVPQALFLKVGRSQVSPLTSICCEFNNRWSYTATALVRSTVHNE